MRQGWIKLHRKLLDSSIADKPNYIAVWITLLLKANHADKQKLWNGKILTIKEGQVLTGRKILAKEIGMAESTLEDILNVLSNLGKIQQQKTTKFRIITISGWDKYQVPNNKATTKQQQTDTLKNVKNVKNTSRDKKEIKISAKIVKILLEEYKLRKPDGNYEYDNIRPARSVATSLKIEYENYKKKGTIGIADYTLREYQEKRFRDILKKMDDFNRANAMSIKYINNNWNKILNKLK